MRLRYYRCSGIAVLAGMLYGCGGSNGGGSADPRVATPSVDRTLVQRLGTVGAVYATDGVLYRDVQFAVESGGASGSDGVYFSGDDAIAFYTQYDRNIETRTLSRIRFFSPGADGLWFTADDAAFDRQLTRMASGGFIDLEVYYRGPAGPDGQYFSPDDPVLSYRKFDAFASRVVGYSNAGSDGTWFTADDIISDYETVDVDAEGRAVHLARFEPGPDGMAFTADDTECSVQQIGYAAGGERSVDSVNTDACSDPSRAGSRVTDVFKADGTQSRQVIFANKGGDGVWLTADDEVGEYREWRRENAVRTRDIRFTGSGADGIWFTADDVVTEQVVRDEFGRGEFKAVSFVGPGPDGLWDTSDDVVGSYARAAVRQESRLWRETAITEYVGAGADAVWFTDDDVVGATRIRVEQWEQAL